MKAFAEYINKSKADSENREKLESIKARVVDTGGLIDLDAFLKGWLCFMTFGSSDQTQLPHAIQAES